MQAPEGGNTTALEILAASLTLSLTTYELAWLNEELSRRAKQKEREEPQRAPERIRSLGGAEGEREPNRPVRRVLLIEDHAVFREALASILDRDPDMRVVARAASLSEGAAKASGDFDVAVVDLSMPDGDGADLVARLRATHPKASIIGLSRRRGRERHARALEMGASKVVRKSDALEDLLGAIKQLSEGELVFLPSVTHNQRAE